VREIGFYGEEAAPTIRRMMLANMDLSIATGWRGWRAGDLSRWNAVLQPAGADRGAGAAIRRDAAPDRIVCGSDFEFGCSDSIDYRLNALRRARIGDALREKILVKNAHALPGLG
jgi:hypothetical protein